MDTSTTARLKIIPTGAPIGAFVEGVDLSKELDAHTFAQIEDAYDRHTVLVFRGQHLTPEQHISFARRFGALEIHLAKRALLAGYPEILLVSNVKDDTGEDIGLSDAGQTWHTDTSYREKPSRGSVLYAREVPVADDGVALGNTLFASTAKAYEDLSEQMKRRLMGLNAIHSYGFRKRPPGSQRSKIAAAVLHETPDVAHPMVRIHPKTGRKALYVFEGECVGIENMAEGEALPLIHELTGICTQRQYIYEHKWQVGDVVMWDNAASLHLAMCDYKLPQRRLLHRVTIEGGAHAKAARSKMDFRKCSPAAAAALFSLGAAYAAPGDYPSKPIRILVAFPPGGAADTSIRIIADKLDQLVGQPIVVENKGGAGGNVGTEIAANAPADGYTLLATSSAFAVNPTMYGTRVGYDAVKDFIPVVVVSTQPNAIAVNEKVPVRTLAELKTMGQSGKLSFGSPGIGTTPHLTCENLFHVAWKADIVHVPYKGAGPASLAVVTGETPVACVAAFGVFQFHKQGRVRILAISSDKRLANLPDVPTLQELGYTDINDYTWTAIFAPAGTPPAVIYKLNHAVNQVLAMPEVKDRLDKGGLLPVGGSPQETASYITSEIQHWTKIVNDTGAKAE